MLGAAEDEMLDDLHTTTEIVARAQRTLPAPVWDHIVGGAETETTIFRNREAIASLAFRARVLRNVASIDTTTTLLQSKLRIPLILAPVGGLQQMTADGAAAAARGASAFGTLQVCSSVSEPSLEETAAAAPGDKWFQLYIRGDRDWIRERLARVRAAGYVGLVITVDSAYYGNRERQVLRRWVPAGRENPEGFEFQRLVDWDTIDDIREVAQLPLILKGIQTHEDAAIALDHGVAALWVSNHGGRQLDFCRGALDVVPEIVNVAAGRVPVIVDGGFMRGSDIVKALALGANAVATGRLYALALAAGGDEGVVRMFEIVEFEMKNVLGSLGVTRLDQLDASYVTRASVPHATAAFPLSGIGL